MAQLKQNQLNRYRNLLFDIKDSLKGVERDYTQGNLKKAIFLLSIPMVLEMIMESVFAIVDIYFVSKLGSQAIATVGITESLITAFIFTIGIGYAVATTAMISRRIGEKRPKDASKVAVQAIFIGIVTSFIIGIPGAIFASDLLAIMGAEEEIVLHMSSYTSIMFAGNGIIMLLFIINAIFRGAGDAAIAMRVLWIANLINIFLDPMLIFGIGPFPELGIKGAAIATNIGRGIAVVYQFYLLLNGKYRIKIVWKEISIKVSIIKQLLKLSLGTIFQYFIATASWMFLVRIISSYGSDVFAGYQIAIRLFIFSLLPSWGISNAAATLVGQNLGAKNPERAEQTVWATGKINMMVMGVVMIIFLIFPDFFVSFFSSDETVISSSVKCLRIVSLGMVFYGLGMVLINSINGAGDTFTPTILNIICFWAIEIPLAYILAKVLNFGENGVFISIVVAESILTVLAIIVFRKGKWKLKEV